MSASDEKPPAKRMRQRRSLTIRREDHIGDPIGLVFLEPAEINGDAVLERLSAYLGDKLRVTRADVSRDEITVEVEARRWIEEGARLAAAARELHAKGARRNAAAMYREALELDPLNAEATLWMGLALTEQEKFAEGLHALKRAREFGAGGVELLLAMGRCAARLDRSAAAVAYYEQALKLEPRNFVARRALSALGKRAAQAGSGTARSGND